MSKMIFQRKTIQLNGRSIIKPKEIRKTETFTVNERKYRIYKTDDHIVIDREYLDFFDTVGIESVKFCITSIGFSDSTEVETITSLKTQVKKGVKSFYTITFLLLLIASLCFDVTFGTYSTFAIFMLYGVIYLVLNHALTIFNDELANDIEQR